MHVTAGSDYSSYEISIHLVDYDFDLLCEIQYVYSIVCGAGTASPVGVGVPDADIYNFMSPLICYMLRCRCTHTRLSTLWPDYCHLIQSFQLLHFTRYRAVNEPNGFPKSTLGSPAI